MNPASYPLNANLFHRAFLAGRFSGNEPITREMVQARTRELAIIAGRPPPQVSQVDYEQAKRELTGESDLDRQNAVLDSGRRGMPWRSPKEARSAADSRPMR